MDIIGLTDQIVEEILPQALLTDEDRQVILDNADFLTRIGEPLVERFFELVFSYEPTRQVFSDAEVQQPTSFVVDWWTRTVRGPLDDDYFRWMTLVGLVHIRRGVKNPMMISMFTIVANTVHDLARAELGSETAEKLRAAFSRYGATVSSLITESYTATYIFALEDLAGLRPELLQNMINITVGRIEEEGRKTLAIGRPS